MEINQSRSHFLRHKEATAYYDQEYLAVRSIVSELDLLAPGR